MIKNLSRMKKFFLFVIPNFIFLVFATAQTKVYKTNHLNIGFGKASNCIENNLLIFCVNGPLVDSVHYPVGGYIDNGIRKQKWIDPLKATGNFSVDNAVFGLGTNGNFCMIPYSDIASLPALTWGFQNGPMLVKNGKNIRGTSTTKYPRSGKELYDQVQGQVKSQVLRIQEPKEFAFTKMMSCGLCDSGICADEKFKKLKDGSVNRHVYYSCTKSKDKYCKCGYINEVDLIEQFEKLLDRINISEIGMKDKIKYEVERIKKFQQSVLNIKQQIQIKDVDIRDYAKFILKDGAIEEKRELLTCFKSKILLKEKQIYIS